jgi:hypothetical protein
VSTHVSLGWGSMAVLTACAVGAGEALPWQVNRPLVSVCKSVYAVHTVPKAAALVSVAYVGAGLERYEIHANEIASDVGGNIRARWSQDNGHTWSEFVAVQPSNLVPYAGVNVWEGEMMGTFDPASGLLVQLWLRQIEVGGVYHNFTYVRTSGDAGRTWSAPAPLRYEEGAEFDPAAPLSPAYLNHNEGYPGSSILRRADGTLVCALAHANAPGDPKNDQRPWRMGSVLFLGRWDAAAKRYEWTAGARVEISPEWSARGLMEPDVAELRDGRLLVVWRGSTHGWDGTVATQPGRKWFSLSSDGGRSLAPVAEWKYDDGTSFYSPSSYHRFLRHSVTGKLYWIGNICGTPPSGNSPRYPLVIAAVDEEKAALRRDTVTAIDDRLPGQPEIELSNFSLLEDRETHALELTMAGYGQNPDGADSYRYVLTLLDRPDQPLHAKRRRVSPWLAGGLNAETVALVRANADILASVSVSGGTPREFTDQVRALGVEVYACVGGSDGAAFAASKSRQELIAKWLERCRRDGLTGIDLDYESLEKSCRADYSTLLRETSKACHAADLKLSTCVSYVMCTWRSNTTPVADPEANIDGGWYDPDVIGKTCDVVRVMCYDMISPSSGAVGPVSSRPWARDAMRFWSQHVPRRKLVMGLPAYSRDFVMNDKRETLSPYAPLPELPPGAPVRVLWLPYEALHQYRYADAQGAEHVFLASDADSTRAHLATAADLRLDTIGFWHAGSVTPAMWAAVREWILAGK